MVNLCAMTRISFIGVRIREVFPGSGRVTGIQVDNNYISLPDEIFENISESGIHVNSVQLVPNIALPI